MKKNRRNITAASLVKAPFKTPLEKVSKILWRAEVLVVSWGWEHKAACWAEEQPPLQDTGTPQDFSKPASGSSRVLDSKS